MSRRITKSVPDSLQEAKRKEDVANSAAASAEGRVAQAGQALDVVETRITTVAAELKILEDKYDSEREALAALSLEIASKQNEMRSVEGELADIISKVAKAEENLQSIISEGAKETERLSKDHQDAMAGYAVTQKAAQQSVTEAKATLTSLVSKSKEVEARIVAASLEEARFKKDVLPEIPKLEGELDNLNHQVLVKKVELQKVEEEIVTAVGKVNKEKNAYDQAFALRTSEESRIQILLQQLIDKEDEVGKKMRSLRAIQDGVDRASARFARQKEDAELTLHLAKSSKVVTQT